MIRVRLLPTIIRLILNALIAWLVGLIFILASLHFVNGGSDFTTTDVMSFSVMTIVASGLLMLLVYLPSLYWLRRRRGELQQRSEFAVLTGVICNVPIFLLLAFLINRKMSASEALGFMLTFLMIGASFGLGFTLINRPTNHTH
jgi:hypothetical protein